MTPEITIRNYRSEDFEKIKELLIEGQLFHSISDAPESFNKKSKHDPESLIVAELSGQIVGFMIIIFDPWMSSIYRLVISNSCRQRGIGTLLVQEAINRLHAREAKFFCFFVNPENDTMLKFCEKNGVQLINFGPYFYFAQML